MASKNEEIREAGDYDISRYPVAFDYPFHKVDMMLFKKAVEDFVLINLPKVTMHEENNHR